MNEKYEEILLWTGATMVISSLLKFLSSSSSSHEKLQQMASKRGHSHRRRIIEICLSDIESVKKAISGGVNSIELCVDRSGSGGLTPSYGLIKEACRVASESETKINILIRPRDGNFVYSDDEFDVMLRDIIVARDAGAHGVVVGILRRDNTIDAVRMAVIRSISHPMELTFHRAFDVCSTPLFQAIEEVISLGCDRLLTSGRAPTAVDSSGTQCLYDIMTYLHRKSQHHDHSDDQNNSSIYSPSHFSRIQIVAASGIKVTNVRELILSTGVYGVHAGSAVIPPVSHSLECNLIDPSFEGEGRGCVDEDLVADFVEESEESWDEIERNSVGSSL